MFGRKLSTVTLAGYLAVAAAMGACRDEATTGLSNVPSSSYAANLRLQSGDVQTGAVALPLPQSLRVRVVDAGGTPVPGAAVSWSVIAGGGSVNPPTGISDANGLVATTWTLGNTLGANTVRAYLSNQYIIDSATFSSTAMAGPPVVIRLDAATAPPANARVASTTAPISYTVVDQFNFPVPDVIVTFTTGFNSGTVSQAADTTDDDGHASTIWTLGTVAGPQTLSASIGGLLPVTFATAATPDTSRQIAVVSGDAQPGAPGALLQNITVQVTDRFGNPVPNEAVTFTDSVGGGHVVTPLASPSITDAGGMASTRWRLGPGLGPQQIRVRIAGSGGQFARPTATTNIAFRDIFAGNYFACGIGTNDLVYCWGFGEDGQLGVSSIVSRNAPSWPVTTADTILGPFPTMRDVSGGKSHACGVSIVRAVFCWGANPDGRQFVQPIGTGRVLTAVDISSPSGSQSSQNNQLLASTRVVSTGESFSCAATLGGVLLCAGNNEVGQIGSGLPPMLPLTVFPAEVVDTVAIAGTPGKFFGIATGERHACAMPRFDPLRVVATSTPWCWGQNSSGQLGDGGALFTDSARLGMVSNPGNIVFDSTSLVAGAAHTCALEAAPPAVGGTAYCWGNNTLGQLGRGTTGPRDAVPLPVVAPPFARLYSGEYHTCGLTPAGTAYCWGNNNAGQLGVGPSGPVSTPAPVPGLFFKNLALGELFTCGIAGTGPGVPGTLGTAGTVRCWGDNEFGQLGTGAFGPNGVPSSAPQVVRNQQ